LRCVTTFTAISVVSAPARSQAIRHAASDLGEKWIGTRIVALHADDARRAVRL
jgi:hypothetical protein